MTPSPFADISAIKPPFTGSPLTDPLSNPAEDLMATDLNLSSPAVLNFPATMQTELHSPLMSSTFRETANRTVAPLYTGAETEKTKELTRMLNESAVLLET